MKDFTFLIDRHYECDNGDTLCLIYIYFHKTWGVVRYKNGLSGKLIGAGSKMSMIGLFNLLKGDA